MPSIRRGHELGSARPDWKYPSRRWVEDVERGVEWEERLDRVLAGDVRPGDASERIGFANLLHMKSLHAEAAQMYAEAFAESATIAEDLEGHHRYNAACAAALAAARGGDATAWRNRALEWLRADLAAREKAGRADTLKHWSGNADLALVRDSIQELPEAEREGWARFWADVNAALARAQKKQ
jgi:pyrroloquinoline quinone (PQQ) biosynthesis protein C